MLSFGRDKPHPDCKPVGLISIGNEKTPGAEDGDLGFVQFDCPRDGKIIVDVRRKGYRTDQHEAATAEVLEVHRTSGVKRY